MIKGGLCARVRRLLERPRSEAHWRHLAAKLLWDTSRRNRLQTPVCEASCETFRARNPVESHRKHTRTRGIYVIQQLRKAQSMQQMTLQAASGGARAEGPGRLVRLRVLSQETCRPRASVGFNAFATC